MLNPKLIALAASLWSLTPLATHAAADAPNWPEQKCRFYEAAWTDALKAFGSDNINYNFIATNENFIASGCTEPTPICPRSTQELNIANALTITLMNAGTASTFLPFRCGEGS